MVFRAFIVGTVLAVGLASTPAFAGAKPTQFEAGSLIIPMDNCYQTGESKPGYCVAGNASADNGLPVACSTRAFHGMLAPGTKTF